MKLEGRKIVLYREGDGAWLAEIPAISGCYAFIKRREEALSELRDVFQMVAEEAADVNSVQGFFRLPGHP